MFVYIRRYKRRYSIVKQLFRSVLKTIKLLFVILMWILTTLYKICKWIYYKIKYKESHYSKSKFWNLIRSINSRQFEVFCCELYKGLGYDAKITKATHDGGVDVILKKDNIVTYVECKHYGKSSYVGREICQKLLGSCVMNKADRAIVFTTGSIHKNAIECEKAVNNLSIVGYDNIYKMFNRLDKSRRSRVLSKTISYTK